MSQDTRIKMEERKARQLCSKVCEGMALKILELGGRPRFAVEVEAKALMQAIRDEAKAQFISQENVQ